MRGMTMTCRSDILSAMRAVCRGKEASGMHPAHVTSLEVAQLLGCGVSEVEDAAESLAAAGTIRIRRTINYDSYEPRQEQDDYGENRGTEE